MEPIRQTNVSAKSTFTTVGSDADFTISDSWIDNRKHLYIVGVDTGVRIAAQKEAGDAISDCLYVPSGEYSPPIRIDDTYPNFLVRADASGKTICYFQTG